VLAPDPEVATPLPLAPPTAAPLVPLLAARVPAAGALGSGVAEAVVIPSSLHAAVSSKNEAIPITTRARVVVPIRPGITSS
jgi:hypothetical protein